MAEAEQGGDICPDPFPMAQAATSGSPGLPCSPKQALALYCLIFRHPASLGQLQTALQQVQEGRGCPPGLELTTVLLEMERNRWAQEQLLWELELLTGAGLGLFRAPWTQFGGRRDEAQHAWSQHSQLGGRMGRDTEQLSSRLYPPPQTRDSLSQKHQFPERAHGHGGASEVAPRSCGMKTADPSSAVDLGEAGRDAEPRWEGPGAPPEATAGCLQELNPTTTSSGESGNSELKVNGQKCPGQGPSQDLAHREERNQEESPMQRSHLQSWQERKLTQEAPESSVLALQCLPAPQDTPQGLDSGPGQERATQKPLSLDPLHNQRKEDPKGQTEKTPQGQRGNASQQENTDVSQSQRRKTFQGQSGEAPQGENKGTPQRGNSPKCQRKETGQGPEMKTLQSWEGTVSQAWEVAQGEAPVGAQYHLRDLCKSLGEQTPQRGERESVGHRGRNTQRMQVKPKGQSQKAAEAVVKLGAARDGASAPLPGPRSPAWPRLPGPGAGMLAALSTEDCGRQGLPVAPPRGDHLPVEQEVGKARLPGALRERRGGPGAPKASKAAWPAPPGGEKPPASVSAAQQESALQRLLELHGAARRRRRREREQQRLRVLERLRIASHRHCRVHPLGLPPSPAQLPPQEDAVGRRRALREQLEQVHLERTRWLRALRARNTQNFQELLWRPGAEKPAPVE